MSRFGDLEAAIMHAVWSAQEPLRVRDVVADLRKRRDIAFNTVQTVMDNLFRKGWLKRAKEGRAYRYWAAASQEDYAAGLVEEALESAPDQAAVLSRLITRLPRDEIAELRAALDEAKRGEELP
ncbi:BlaI/MecI/CopY family transcriptional regulator [Nocardiopsis sp. RSe5-2]|uniref:BlaI/MecI/CopY family transcriptional regulator n=1 Tax=Nocardiopsis endophytica TaxID=3018445 RepID=A0ABT4UE11_9ACTN|nr:BlaI/MecI/CopY family transcriptional regulator [Nocardiopsis endophytica]MDA2815230.1 BlaI/MecI/CopY family transcriptional regulator [Nocardiopsis endophytica]